MDRGEVTNRVVTRGHGLIEAEVDGELVALHVENGTCYGFNRTATRIWKLIERPRTIAQLRDVLMDEFEIDAARCTRQVTDLLVDLERDGLVELHDPHPL